jgi:galactose mutarotase-like enzyme
VRFERCPAEHGLPERWMLSNEGDGVSAVVVPSGGMNLTSLVVGGSDRLMLPLPLAEFMSTAKTGGVPLLHPWANRLRGDAWSFDGVEVDLAAAGGLKRDGAGLPMHGLLLRATDWAIQAADDHPAIVGRLDWRSDRPEFGAFPFEHAVEISWSIAVERPGVVAATCGFAVEAGSRDVPIATGWHPYLRPTIGADRRTVTLKVPRARQASLDERGLPERGDDGRPTLGPDHDVSGPLGDRTFDDLFLVGDTGWSATVTSGPASIELVADPAWRWVQLYAPAGSDFVCIEPMLVPTAALSDGGAVRVAAGSRFEASFTIRVRIAGEEDR